VLKTNEWQPRHSNSFSNSPRGFQLGKGLLNDAIFRIEGAQGIPAIQAKRQ